MRYNYEKLQEYLDRHNVYLDWAEGCVEPGYDDIHIWLLSGHDHRVNKLFKWLEWEERRNPGTHHVEYSDEWCTCNGCHKAFRTQPDNMAWAPSYVKSNYDYICLDCAADEIPDVARTVMNSVEYHDTLPEPLIEPLIEDGWMPVHHSCVESKNEILSLSAHDLGKFEDSHDFVFCRYDHGLLLLIKLEDELLCPYCDQWEECCSCE